MGRWVVSRDVVMCDSAMGSQNPSPTHIGKSQHGGKKVPTFESQEPTKVSLESDLDYFMLNIPRACVDSWV